MFPVYTRLLFNCLHFKLLFKKWFMQVRLNVGCMFSKNILYNLHPDVSKLYKSTFGSTNMLQKLIIRQTRQLERLDTFHMCDLLSQNGPTPWVSIALRFWVKLSTSATLPLGKPVIRRRTVFSFLVTFILQNGV